jgi:hypothetical protein
VARVALELCVERQELGRRQSHGDGAGGRERAERAPGARRAADEGGVHGEEERRVRHGIDAVAVDHRRDADGGEHDVPARSRGRRFDVDGTIEQIQSPRQERVEEVPGVARRELQ